MAVPVQGYHREVGGLLMNEQDLPCVFCGEMSVQTPVSRSMSSSPAGKRLAVRTAKACPSERQRRMSFTSRRWPMLKPGNVEARLQTFVQNKILMKAGRAFLRRISQKCYFQAARRPSSRVVLAAKFESRRIQHMNQPAVVPADQHLGRHCKVQHTQKPLRPVFTQFQHRENRLAKHSFRPTV